jgi:hypothetical protein|nr:protein LITTLE ZIPPER 3-like [Lolium perenne]
MERANTDLMLQNLCIMEENERLRRMARELDQENKKMLADLRMKQQQQQQQQMATSSRTAAQMAPGGASSGATARASKSGKKQPK